MKKILSICLIVGMALVTLTGCINNHSNESNEANTAYWQEAVDSWCIENYGDGWYGEITSVDPSEGGYITFDPLYIGGDRFGGSVMISKTYLIEKYINQTSE